MIAVLLTNLVVVAIVGYSIQQSRIAHEDQAKIAAENLSRLLAQNISNIVLRIDLGLLASVDEIERYRAHGTTAGNSIGDFLARQHRRMVVNLPELDALRFADAKGIIRSGVGVKAGSLISIADRDYFVRLRDDANAGVVISKPILGRVSGQWAIAIGRRCNKADGSFDGVAYAVILLSQFRKMFSELSLGPSGAISLRDADLNLIVRFSAAQSADGEVGNRLVSAELLKSLQSYQDHNTYIAATGMDGVTRAVSYRRAVSYPAYVLVGLATDDYLSDWRKQSEKLAIMAALFCMTTLVFGRLFWESWRRNELDMAALAASEADLREAQRIANLGHFAYDLRTDQWINSNSLNDLFGISGNEAFSTDSWLARVAPDSRQEIQTYLKTVIERRLAFDREFRIIRVDDGQERWLTAKGRLQFDGDGNPATLVGTMQDITERKLADADRQALHGEMEQLMRFHVASQTIAAMAHELNQPLNALASYSEAALCIVNTGNSKPELLRRALERSAEQVQRAGRVVHELFAFMNQSEVKSEPVDIAETVTLALSRIKGNDGGALQTQVELEPDLPRVTANRLQVGKVLDNLFQNGIEAMRGADIKPFHLDVKVATSADGKMAEVIICDRGPGIDGESLNRIFEQFYTTKPDGLGMGLAISRAIIEAHGGQLWVESKPGSGACFHLTLPFMS